MRKIFRETLPVLLMAAIQGCASGGGTPVPSSTANAAGAWRGEAGVSGVAVPASLPDTPALKKSDRDLFSPSTPPATATIVRRGAARAPTTC